MNEIVRGPRDVKALRQWHRADAAITQAWTSLINQILGSHFRPIFQFFEFVFCNKDLQYKLIYVYLTNLLQFTLKLSVYLIYI